MTITSTWSAGTNDATSPVTVTVSYQCTLSAGQLIGIANPKVSATSTMRITH